MEWHVNAPCLDVLYVSVLFAKFHKGRVYLVLLEGNFMDLFVVEPSRIMADHSAFFAL
jgi:hypothetical protein